MACDIRACAQDWNPLSKSPSFHEVSNTLVRFAANPPSILMFVGQNSLMLLAVAKVRVIAQGVLGAPWMA